MSYMKGMKNLFECSHDVNNPRMMGHRGFTPIALENSLPSFEAAGKLGLWGIGWVVEQVMRELEKEDVLDYEVISSGPLLTWKRRADFPIEYSFTTSSVTRRK